MHARDRAYRKKEEAIAHYYQRTEHTPDEEALIDAMDGYWHTAMLMIERRGLLSALCAGALFSACIGQAKRYISLYGTPALADKEA